MKPEQALYGVCQGILPAQRIFSPSSVSLFDLKARFFVPTRPSLTAARAGAVKVGRRTNLSACSALARPCLDGLEHDGTLTRSGRRSEGSLPSGADHRAATLYSVGPWGPDHDAVMRIGGKALLGGGPILETAINTMACFG